MINWIQEATQAGTQAATSSWSNAILSAGVVAAVVGLVSVIVGQYLTGRRHNETLRLTEQGQITERFTRAINQLGAIDDKGKKKLEIRLGGIYALERIAKDSERDYWPIMETLTTYVREHAPWPPKKDATKEGFLPPPNAAQRYQEAANISDQPESETPTLAPDIQAILTVLARRSRYYGNGELAGNGELQRLDLRNTDLRNVYLYEANLQGAYLRGANLQKASIQEANLKEANLLGANLKEANLFVANLERANLERANLQGANLEKADPTDANLREADLHEAEGLVQGQLEAAIGDTDTILPEGLERPKSWAQGESRQLD